MRNATLMPFFGILEFCAVPLSPSDAHITLTLSSYKEIQPNDYSIANSGLKEKKVPLTQYYSPEYWENFAQSANQFYDITYSLYILR